MCGKITLTTREFDRLKYVCSSRGTPLDISLDTGSILITSRSHAEFLLCYPPKEVEIDNTSGVAPDTYSFKFV
jgi:hypothetical protein